MHNRHALAGFSELAHKSQYATRDRGGCDNADGVKDLGFGRTLKHD